MQTRVGAMKAATTNKDKHGKDFYTRIGSLGGKVKSPLKGFGSDRSRAAEAGRKGGSAKKKPRTSNE